MLFDSIRDFARTRMQYFKPKEPETVEQWVDVNGRPCGCVIKVGPWYQVIYHGEEICLCRTLERANRMMNLVAGGF